MLRTECFRRQQQATSMLMLRLCNLVDLYRDSTDALRIAMQLARLLGQLRLQFAIEDRSLYAVLIASGDPRVTALARPLRDRMGTLSLDLEQFVQRWSSSALIDSDFATFKAGLMDLLDKLHEHSERSTEALFPLVEALVPPPLSDAA